MRIYPERDLDGGPEAVDRDGAMYRVWPLRIQDKGNLRRAAADGSSACYFQFPCAWAQALDRVHHLDNPHAL